MPTDLDTLATRTISRSRLDDQQLAHEVTTLGPRWSTERGKLVLRLRGPMTRTGAVAAHAGALADEIDHHPNIALEYAGLTLEIDTHDAKAITMLDLVYAARLEQWLRDNGW